MTGHFANIDYKVGQAIALCQTRRGKSGLHRVKCQVMPGRREPTESATENIPPVLCLAQQVRVKWCGKSAPHGWQQSWQGKPHSEQDQIGILLALLERMTRTGFG